MYTEGCQWGITNWSVGLAVNAVFTWLSVEVVGFAIIMPLRKLMLKATQATNNIASAVVDRVFGTYGGTLSGLFTGVWDSNDINRNNGGCNALW